MILHVSVVLHRSGNQVQLPSTLDMGTTVPIAITIMFTHMFVTCDKFIICIHVCAVWEQRCTTPQHTILIEERNDKVIATSF